MSSVMDQIRLLEGLDDFTPQVEAIGPLAWRQRALVATGLAAVRMLRLRASALDPTAFVQRVAATNPHDLTIETRPGAGIDVVRRTLFERTGVAGPFRLLDEAEAADLHTHCQQLLASPDNPLLRVIRRHNPRGAERLLASGDVQLGLSLHMHDPTVRAVLGRPAVRNVMRSLIGTDSVACWRSQLFRQKRGQRTTLHQSIAFPEGVGHTALKLRPGHTFRPHSALNAWISLTRAGVDNGCLLALEGSFRDTRVYDLGAWLALRPLDFLTVLAFLPEDVAEAALKVVLFTSGNHRGVTKLLLRIADFFHDDLFAQEVQSRDFVCKPGEYWVFTSFNLHGSHAATSDDERFTLVGRYIDTEAIDPGDNAILLNVDGRITVRPAEHGWHALVA